MLYFHKEYFNIKGNDERRKKAKERMSYDSTIKINLDIKPIDQPNIYKLFYVPTNTTIELISKIYRQDGILENIYDKLPEVAQTNFFIEILSTELHSSNKLEGVRSSKEEIVKTTKKIIALNNKINKVKARFNNVIRSYFELKQGNLTPPIDANDCRKIYDEITVDEILKEDLPDGKYFRNNITYIYKGINEIHRGVLSNGANTEELIIEKMKNLLDFMNEDNNINKLIKIAISHYYFGYIHPFYDGNGRTGRFISSIFLKREFSWLTAMSLSQGCSKEREKYLKIFDITNQLSSQGEINYFVDEFLSIMLTGQESILQSLISKSDLLNIIIEKIETDSSLSNDDEKTIMKFMAQEHLFNSNKDGIGVKELNGVFNYTAETIRNKLKNLCDRELLDKVKGKPVNYIISKDYLEN